MKVRELKEMLEKCVNQDAELNIRVNPIQGDCEEFDIPNCNIDVMGVQTFQEVEVDCVDVVITKNQSEADKNNSLFEFFFGFEYPNLNIILNPKRKTILVTDINDEKLVYREIEIEDDTLEEPEIKTEMLKKLFNML